MACGSSWWVAVTTLHSNLSWTAFKMILRFASGQLRTFLRQYDAYEMKNPRLKSLGGFMLAMKSQPERLCVSHRLIVRPMGQV